mgnify:CR=1 FL=1
MTRNAMGVRGARGAEPPGRDVFVLAGDEEEVA